MAVDTEGDRATGWEYGMGFIAEWFRTIGGHSANLWSYDDQLSIYHGGLIAVGPALPEIYFLALETDITSHVARVSISRKSPYMC